MQCYRFYCISIDNPHNINHKSSTIDTTINCDTMTTVASNLTVVSHFFIHVVLQCSQKCSSSSAKMRIVSLDLDASVLIINLTPPFLLLLAHLFSLN
jgi:disulfide bond formation protein DsbB